LFKLKSEVNEIEDVIRFKIDFPPFDGLKFVCVYLLKVDGINILIDAGLHFRDWKNLFFSSLKNLNITIKDIDYCIITHDHLDHLGLIKDLKRKNPDLQLLMHEITHEIIEWGTNPNKSKELENEARELAKRMIKYGISEKQGDRIVQVLTAMPKLARYQKPDKLLVDNEEISIGTNKLKIIWTPGHAVGHICVFDTDRRYLFSGDHILSEITPHIGSFIMSPTLKKKYDFNNILDYYLRSLEKIDLLNPSIIFPAHQEVIYNPSERILEIKEHHKNRLKEISNIIKNNPLTPVKIAEIHFGNDLTEINSFLALSEVLSHLIYLEDQNKITRIEKNGKFLFSS